MKHKCCAVFVVLRSQLTACHPSGSHNLNKVSRFSENFYAITLNHSFNGTN